MPHTAAATGLQPAMIENAWHWRAATKHFDKDRIVPDSKVKLLLETLRLSPSSINLQPWKFVLIKSKAVREAMSELAMNQPQITEASHLLLLCSLKKINAAYFDKLVQLEKTQNNGISLMENFKPVAMAFLESKTAEQLRQWMAEQVYIALGFLLAACALLHIDACPIEGFHHAKVNKLLDLHRQGLESRVMVAVGYRTQSDQCIVKPKLRWPKQEVVLTI